MLDDVVHRASLRPDHGHAGVCAMRAPGPAHRCALRRGNVLENAGSGIRDVAPAALS
jgi:hypothetical protein